jgi:methylated-DNA-[protein]-cysteine S-methyltransferase
MSYICKYSSPIGTITITSDWENITGLWLEWQKYFPLFLENYKENKDLKVFKDTIKWLDCYFQGKKPNFDIPVKAEWTAFRKEVWKILIEIPYGKTTTYGKIAERLAKKIGIKKMSARGVGGAVGHNPISIIIPCHRVIWANGSLTGYAGWIDKKMKLLELEWWKTY